MIREKIWRLREIADELKRLADELREMADEEDELFLIRASQEVFHSVFVIRSEVEGG